MTTAYPNDPGKDHNHDDNEREIKIIIKDSLVIINLGELDDKDLRDALTSFMEARDAQK